MKTHHIELRLIRWLVLATAILVALFGCARLPAPVKGGASTQGFADVSGWGMPTPAAPADAPAPRGVSQGMSQPDNPQGSSRQNMSEERTEVKPDGTVVRVVRRASTELGGAQDVADILKAYASGEYAKRMLLALFLGAAAWFLRLEWPVAAGVLAAGAVATAFFGPVAALVAACLAGGLWIAWHVLKSRIPVPLP